MIDSEGGAFGFDCYLASPEFRVFQQPAKGLDVMVPTPHKMSDKWGVWCEVWGGVTGGTLSVVEARGRAGRV